MCPTPPSRLLLEPFELDEERSGLPHERVKRPRLKEKHGHGIIPKVQQPNIDVHAQPEPEPSPTSQSSVESSTSSAASSSLSTPIPTPPSTSSTLSTPVTPIPEHTPLKRSLPLSTTHAISFTSSPTASISSHSSSPSCSPRTLGPIRRSRSSRLTSTEMRRRRHRYKDGIRYHSLKAQLDNLREVTLEFQTHVARQWETRTEEWSEPKQANKKVLDRIREQRPDCGRAVLLHSASAMIRHLNNEITELRAKIAAHEGDSITSIPYEPSDMDLTACMEAMIRLAHDQQMLQMGGCMITRYSMDGMIMETNDLSCQYGYTQENVIGTICTSGPHMEEAVPLPPTVDIASTTAKQLMTTFLPTSNLVTPWWQHMLLVPVGMVVPFISRRRTPQGQYEMNVYWRQVEQGIDGIRSIYSVGWDAKVEFLPIPTSKLMSSSTGPLPISSIPTSIIEIS